MIIIVKKWFKDTLFSIRRYPSDIYGNRFNRKEIHTIINGVEVFLKEVFPKNTPSINSLKQKLKKDFLCLDNEIPLLIEELLNKILKYETQKATLSIIYADLDNKSAPLDGVVMEDDFTQQRYEKIYDEINEIRFLANRMENILVETETEIFKYILQINNPLLKVSY